MLLCFFASLTSLFDIVTVYIVTDKEEEIVAVCEVVEEDSSCEAPAKEVSRMRRLLVFQLMLSEKKQCPLVLPFFTGGLP